MLMDCKESRMNYITRKPPSDNDKPKSGRYTTWLKDRFGLSDEEIANILIAFNYLDYATINLDSVSDTSVEFKYKGFIIKINVNSNEIAIIIHSKDIHHTIIYSRSSNNFNAYYNFQDMYAKQDNKGLKIFNNLENIKEYSNSDLISYDTDDQGLLIGFGKYMFMKYINEWSKLIDNERKMNSYGQK